jgi:hypothetical protein
VTLAETQALFHGLVTGEEPRDQEALERCFAGTDELGAAERVAIYRNMYRARLVDALRETFPNLARFLGEERFAALGGAYLAEHPSEHHDVGRVGRLLAPFLREFPDPDRPDLSDLAELEWARNEVFFAPESPAVGVEALTRLGVDAQLRMVPSLRVVVLTHDATALWRRLESGASPDPVARGPATVAVWRRGFDVFHLALPPEEAAALHAALDGLPLRVICESFAGLADPAAGAHATISSWFLEGWVGNAALASP